MNYFRLRPCIGVGNKWVLGDVDHVDNWLFIQPPVNFMEPGRYSLQVKHDGAQRDFSLAGYASVPIVSARFRNALEGLPEVDEPHANTVMEPVVIEGQRARGSYFVLIVETCVDCVDESRSAFEKFERDDPVRPDLAGQYRAFAKLVLDGGKVGSWHIFRLGGFGAALIVSEEVKSRLERAGVTDVIFEQVG
ncbi:MULTISPECIES: imm11 family protein [Stenotrophomonas]|uniref:Immunity MXAN-0049 protein domain-containing protein n=1 Tax=Stenotrophomonas maltophilia TaxID=40324 RepID=A0A3S0HF70_STEMA|nr:DUF1629 domain-containing protein [Stenotrophomonas maltophilia]RTQ90136.1 hypothetical protein EKL94_07760 [Stenotrophomonas maltophilia]